MKRLLYIIIGIITLSGSLYSQTGYHSIHQLQHNKYKSQNFQQEVPVLTKQDIPFRERSVDLDREVFGFHPYWMGTAWQNYNFNLLSTVAFFGVDVNVNGSLGNDHGWPVNSLISTAHQHGVKVVLVAILFNGNDIATLLNSETNRQNLIDNLLTSVQNAGADGVNIDFEGMPSGQKTNFVTFMTDLTNAFHDAIPNSSVTVDTPPVDWSNNFDYDGLADACDGLMIMGYPYHWDGSSTTGPVSPLYGPGSLSVSWTIQDYLSKTGDAAEKLIIGLPYYGFEWPASGAGAGAQTEGSGEVILYSEAKPLAETFGLLRDTDSGEIPWYRYQDNDLWYQGWFDDSLSLAVKYQYALQEDLAGVGIWALGYDGQHTELWGALADHFAGDSLPPNAPQNFYSVVNSSGNVEIGVSSISNATEYVIYSSGNGRDFTEYDSYASPLNVISDFQGDSLVYLRVTARNSTGESNPTEVLAVVPGTSEPRALVVNGFDRINGTTNTHDFIRQHGGALWGNGVAVDAASNEAVKAGSVSLEDYATVDWILGEEGTSTDAFDAEEQTIVMNYLDSGGNFFVSGSEIGYDLAGNGSDDDLYFYENYLKAEYISDAAGYPLSFYGEGPIFGSLTSVNFDDGSHGTYHVDYPDGIHPVGSAETILKYDESDYDTQGGAGIAFTGSFSLGAPEGRLVYISPGFETIYPTVSQLDVMNKILTYFEVPTDIEHSGEPIPEDFDLLSAYPNPFNATVTVRYQIPVSNPGHMKIVVYDLLGRQVRTLLDKTVNTGKGEVQWNGSNQHGKSVATGTYLIVAQHKREHKTLKITLLK